MNASRVSRVLAACGMTRASAYKTFGRDVDGFVVMVADKRGPNEGGSIVVFTGSAREQAEQYERAMAVLTEAGFKILPYGRPGVGGTYGLQVAP